MERPIRIPSGASYLDGDLALPVGARGVVLFAHGSGSSRHSTRNRYAAQQLQNVGFGALLLDLLTPSEARIDAQTAHFRFNVALLTQRVEDAARWLQGHPETQRLAIGLFGASTGAAAALVAASNQPDAFFAVVSRGGRPDLAGPALATVRAPCRFIVGGADALVARLNREALAQLHGVAELQIVPGAGHLFEEPGALERASELAAAWFQQWLPPGHGARAAARAGEPSAR